MNIEHSTSNIEHPFFGTPERIERLQFHAAGWLGTPFMPNAMVKGHGVSCQKLVGALYIESGFWPAGFKVPDAAMDWSNAHTDGLIEQFMSARTDFAPVGRADLPVCQPGDLIGIKIGGCIHHCGIVLSTDGKFIHCLRGVGVSISNVRDASYLARIQKIWRPLTRPADTLSPTGGEGRGEGDNTKVNL